MRRNERRNRAKKGPAVEHSTADPIARAAEQVSYLQSRLANPDDLIGRHEVLKHLAQIQVELKSTHESHAPSGTDDLVNESIYVASEQVNSVDEEIIFSSPRRNDESDDDSRNGNPDRKPPADRLVLTTVRRAGRASVSRSRQSYFVEPTEVSPEEQAKRSRRSREANARSAARSAADHAIAADCGLWATFTFAGPISWEQAAIASREFLSEASRRHSSTTGDRLYYVGVVDVSQAQPHLHILMSRSADGETLRELWTHGIVESVALIPSELIEQKVNYMKNRVLEVRATRSRFLRTRGLDLGIIQEDVSDFEQARNVLRDQIAPVTPRVVSAQPFGGNPRLGFRFTPLGPTVDQDGDLHE